MQKDNYQSDWIRLERKHVKKRGVVCRYPIAFAGKSADYTILKHLHIYKEYLKVRKTMNDLFPELANFLPKRYFYMILSERFGLSYNYICSIVAGIQKMGSEAYKKADVAKKRVIANEYSKNQRASKRDFE